MRYCLINGFTKVELARKYQVVFAGIAMTTFCGCQHNSSSNVSGLPPYNAIIGKTDKLLERKFFVYSSNGKLMIDPALSHEGYEQKYQLAAGTQVRIDRIIRTNTSYPGRPGPVREEDVAVVTFPDPSLNGTNAVAEIRLCYLQDAQRFFQVKNK